MPSGINKAKGRQSYKKANYYKAQFLRTAKNKLRRKQRIERRKRNIPQCTTAGNSAVFDIDLAVA